MTRKLWPLALENIRVLNRVYGPAMDETAAAAGLEGPEWSLLLPALLFEPDPISAARLHVRGPYTADHSYDARLARLAGHGMLVSAAEKAYRLTDTGRDMVERIIGTAYSVMDELEPLPAADSERLALLLGRLVDAVMAAPVPPDKWSITLSRRTDPGERASVVVRIDQYLSDLNAYRDDAHLAAWRPHGVSGPAWEAFTLLDRSEAQTLNGLYEKLKWRGHPRKVYEEALRGLIERGWVEQDAEEMGVTAKGRAIRQDAEDATDRHFYGPWVCLNSGEVDELEQLLRRLPDALQAASG